MARIPDSFTEWTAPWKDEDFDAERAKRLVYNALFDKQAATDDLKATKTKVMELEGELDTEKARKADPDPNVQQELKDLRQENRKLKEEAGQPDPSHQKAIDRLTDVIDFVDKGLPKALAMRVQGDDAEARLADAKELAKVANVDFGDEDGKDGEGDDGNEDGSAGPPSNSPQSRLRTGFDRGQVSEPSNPAKAAEALPALWS